MKKRHSCTKERLCGCVRTRLDKTIIDTVSLDKCAAHLPIGISRTFCGMTNQYVFFEKVRPQKNRGGRFLAQAEDGGK